MTRRVSVRGATMKVPRHLFEENSGGTVGLLYWVCVPNAVPIPCCLRSSPPLFREGAFWLLSVSFLRHVLVRFGPPLVPASAFVPAIWPVWICIVWHGVFWPNVGFWSRRGCWRRRPIEPLLIHGPFVRKWRLHWLRGLGRLVAVPRVLSRPFLLPQWP